VAVVAAALALAHPARADSPDAPDTSTVAAVTAPDPSALTDAAAAAAQGGATNVSVSVRIGSPGDNGDVSQTISVSTGAQATSTDSGSQQNTVGQAQSTQTSPANVSISVRIDSPGTDGAVTQTNSAASSASTSTSTQYQAPATQYPASPTPATPPPAPDPAAAAPQPDASPAPAQTVTPAPSSWVWNLTVSGCGDTSGGDITKTIDTGIQGWIWNWNLGTICQAQAPISPVNPAESGGDISPPSLPAPDPPTPPTIMPLGPLILPNLPQPVIAATARAVVVVPVLGPIELPIDLAPVATQDPLSLSQVLGLLSPTPSRAVRRHAPSKLAPRTGVLAATTTLDSPVRIVTTQPVLDSRTTPRRVESHKAPPWETLSLILESGFAAAPAGSSAGGAGGVAGGGATAALSLWLLLQLPGFASLRLPARQRRPRGRVDDKRTRPG
jgi:hypothetical protein